MLPLMLFLAKLIGLLFLVFSLLMAMIERAMLAAIDELVRSRGLMLIAGSFNLAAGLAIVLGHNVWSRGALTVVVTLIGWLVALRGVVWLFTPQEKIVQYYEALHFEEKYYVATAITGALGLYLSIAGFVGNRESPVSGERETPTAKTSFIHS
jgi:FtsH-binding integral membrane protein